MRKLMTISALIVVLTAASTAQAGVGRWGEDLRFVAETSIPKAGSTGTVDLCHLVDFADVFFVPVFTRVQGYALSNDGCTGNNFREVTPENFAIMQASGLIDANLPASPSVGLKSLLWGQAWLLIAGAGILYRVFGAMFGGNRRPKKTGAADALAVHSLVAMAQVAIADGQIDAAETRQIASILTRLTGKSYSPDQITELLNRLNPTSADMDQVGQDLSEKDRQIVLEAALNIAVADGAIHPNEYAVVSELAQRLRIGADQFRSALTRISAHLQTADSA